MILLIDNYDSFTYNIYQYLGEVGAKVLAIRNDKISIEEIEMMSPEAIVLSPGPGRPEHAGICVEVVKRLGGTIPILGICLGHEAIGYAYGGKIITAKKIMHGKESKVNHSEAFLFKGLPQLTSVMRYHSLVIERQSLPDTLEIVAESADDKEIMAIKHKRHPVYGLQFHPESIGTETGKQIFLNFVEQIRKGTERSETISGETHKPYFTY
jgi:anthranilate synthase component II